MTNLTGNAPNDERYTPGTIYTEPNLATMARMADNSIDAIVTDPPYGLKFMDKKWDHDVPGVDIWRECLRVLKPGGHLLAFAGTRTQHRMACAIEDAGFEIRDMIAWVYGSGFPKSTDISKAIDRSDASEMQNARRLRFTSWLRSTGITSAQVDAATGTNMGGHYLTAKSQPAIMTREHLELCRNLIGCVPEWVEKECDIRSVESKNMAEREVVGVQKNAMSGWDMDGGTEFADRNITAPATDLARQWAGWGSSLKPALEPISVCRKPLNGTLAGNVTTWGTGGLNIDGCRVGTEETVTRRSGDSGGNGAYGRDERIFQRVNPPGRFPANLLHDGSDEVVGLFPDDNARFFYVPKASRAERDLGLADLPIRSGGDVCDREDGTDGLNSPRAGAGRNGRVRNHHPTVKPIDLMRYLCRLVTPPGGLVYDPFCGSGTTLIGAKLEGFRWVGSEMDPEYAEIARKRVASVTFMEQMGLFDALTDPS